MKHGYEDSFKAAEALKKVRESAKRPVVDYYSHEEEVEPFSAPPRTSFDKPEDAVNHPGHYTKYKIQPVHFIMENDIPFWAGNVIKYVLRHGDKDGIQDLKKAQRYLEMQIKKLEGDPSYSQ